MYQLIVRLYEIRGRVEAYGYYSCETAGAEKLLAQSKASVPLDVSGGDDLHETMLFAASRVCGGIAQKIDVPLF